MRGTVAFVLAALLCGCSHDLEIRDLDRFSERVMDASQAGLSVGLALDSSGLDDEILAQEVASALQRQARYHVTYPATDFTWADVFIRMTLVEKEKTGSVGNFFVCFPGFLLFTHAWLGYAYHSTLTVRCDLVAAVTGEHIGTIEVPIGLDMRQAELDRTWANGFLGWYYAGIPCFINGFFCVPYDPDLDPVLRREVFPILGAHVASQIIRTLNALPWQSNDALGY